MGLHDDASPEAKGVGFVGNEVEPTGDGPPFALEDGPGGLRGGGKFLLGGGAAAALGVEVGDFVKDEGAQESKVAAGSGEEAVFAFGVPTGDALLQLGR